MAQISKSTRFLKNSQLELFSGFGTFKKRFLLMAEKSSAIFADFSICLHLEPVRTMSPEKMTVGSKYSQISLGLIGK